jgi:branched-chain amino acid aminotransferase
MMIGQADRGFLLGDGFFDTLRVQNGKPLLLRRHQERLRRALTRFGMDEAWPEVLEAMYEATEQLHGQTGSLRTTVSRGEGPRGLRPPKELLPVVTTLFSPSAGRPVVPASAVISSFARSPSAPSSRFKTLSYIDNVLALADAAGADDAIVLNTDDRAASTTMANVYALKKGRWLTPPCTEGCLDGIVRGVLIENGAVTEEKISQEDLTRHPLARSNSLIGVQPLVLRGGAPPDLGAVARLTALLEEAEKTEE